GALPSALLPPCAAEAGDLIAAEVAPAAGGDAFEPHRADRGTLEAVDAQPQAGEQRADLVVAALCEREAQARLVGIAPDHAARGGRGEERAAGVAVWGGRAGAEGSAVRGEHGVGVRGLSAGGGAGRAGGGTLAAAGAGARDGAAVDLDAIVGRIDEERAGRD